MKGSEGQSDGSTDATQAVEDFIARWSGVSGTERANYQLFLTELCTALALPQPDPASDVAADNAYVFERPVISTARTSATPMASSTSTVAASSPSPLRLRNPWQPASSAAH